MTKLTHCMYLSSETDNNLFFCAKVSKSNKSWEYGGVKLLFYFGKILSSSNFFVRNCPIKHICGCIITTFNTDPLLGRSDLWSWSSNTWDTRHQVPSYLLGEATPSLDIMTKWLNAPPLWNVFIAITTPSPVPSQVWIFKQHLIHSSPPPHLTLSTLSGQPRSVKGVPLSKFDSSHSSTIYWPGLILLNIVTISTWWILFPCTFDVRFRAVNKSSRSFTVSREGLN